MSDTEEKNIPSNSSDISIEEIGAEGDNIGTSNHEDGGDDQHIEGGQPPAEVSSSTEAPAIQEILDVPLDDVSRGGRIEEVSEAEIKAAESQPQAEVASGAAAARPAPAPAAPPAALRSMLENSDDEDEESEEEEDEDDIDETLLERLVGLSEMFPESVRHGTCSLLGGSVSLAHWSYAMSRTISWIVFSSSVTLFLPIMIETERMGIEEAQKQQQRQILLGPGAAMSAGSNAPLPPMPS